MLNLAERVSMVRKEVADLPRYNSGLPEEYVKEHYKIDRVVRLASNENPFGVGTKAARAAADALAGLSKYSDPEARRLRLALAAAIGVEASNIVVGNGSEELICLVCRACLRPGDRVVTVTPSFLLHEIYPAEQRAEVVAVPMRPDLTFPVEGILNAMAGGCRMLILSNPSNPVGTILTATDLDCICRNANAQTLLVIDEAYYEYARESADYPDSLRLLAGGTAPYAILRTFSKAYGLAGARVGYGIFSDPNIAGHIDKLRTPFNVNRIAQAAALAALDDPDHIEKTITHNRRERERLSSELQRFGYHIAPSQANFLFIDVGRDSANVAERLLQAGIVVKPWRQPGFQQFMRVTLGSCEDNNLFLQALACLS
jgi:histidinol-phosphate aminotransferase